MRNPAISLKEKGLYAYLATYSDFNTSETYVSINKIANECGVDPSTVKRTLRSLEKLGLITRTKRGANQSCLTTLKK